tara:strand:- start:772 stop:987 length:216 start_codon:yes stop_codon:yes gene_type:complete
MELIDTPNPNAKKILISFNNDDTQNIISNKLDEIEGISSVFFGPGFITISKNQNIQWETINQDIISIFDKL